MDQPVVPDRRLDQVDIAVLKGNSAISATRSSQDVNLVDIISKPPECLVHSKPRLAAGQKRKAASGWQVGYAHNCPQKDRKCLVS